MTDKQQVNARLSAQARATLAAIHERTGTNRTAIIEFALAFLLAGLDGGWVTEEQMRGYPADPDLLAAIDKLLDYRRRNTLNWQTEKADYYFDQLRAAVEKYNNQVIDLGDYLTTNHTQP